MRRAVVGVLFRAVELAALLSVVVLASCWFFPAEGKYYATKNLVDELGSFSYDRAVMDSEGRIYFQEDWGSAVRRWSESAGMEVYQSFTSVVKDMAIDAAGAKLYILESTNLWEYDLGDDSKTLVKSVSSDCQAIGMAGDYLVAGSSSLGYDLIRRSDFSVMGTIAVTIEIDDYFFLPQASKLLARGGTTYGGSDSLRIIEIDQANGNFLGMQQFDNSGIADFVLAFPGEAKVLTRDGSILDGNMGYVGGLVSDGDQAWISDACVFNDRLITIGGNSIRIRSPSAPYDELEPQITLELSGGRLFVHDGFLFVLGESGGADRQLQIYKFDKSIM